MGKRRQNRRTVTRRSFLARVAGAAGMAAAWPAPGRTQAATAPGTPAPPAGARDADFNQPYSDRQTSPPRRPPDRSCSDRDRGPAADPAGHRKRSGVSDRDGGPDADAAGCGRGAARAR